MNILEWLQNWYQKHCVHEWEHSYGVKVETLDNPGWLVQIDVRETPLENKPFPMIDQDRGEGDWIFCKVENCVFQGVGDPQKLARILEAFREWAEENC